MNLITQSNHNFPTTYGVVSTTRGALCCYLHEIILNFFYAACGTFLDRKSFRFCRKELRNRVLLQTNISIFTQKLDFQQAIKYGAVLYVAAAMSFMLAGICSRQNGPVQYNERAIARLAPLPHVPTIHPSTDVYAAYEQTAIQDSAAAREEAAEPDLPFEEHILQAAQTYQVDATLIRAIIMAESSYNPRAVSHRGAQGLMQLMPTTAKWLGIEDSFDPAMNIDGGVRYFKKLLDRFDGDVKLALAAYNAGSRYVRKYGGVPPFKATRIYIKKVLRYHRILQDQLAASGNGLITG
jgi:soluble lytic murein transglycosylase-like protein